VLAKVCGCCSGVDTQKSKKREGSARLILKAEIERQTSCKQGSDAYTILAFNCIVKERLRST